MSFFLFFFIFFCAVVVVIVLDGRWVHAASGRSYNIFSNPPKVVGKDDVTGEPLVRRSDDTADKLRSRLKAFHQQTQPVIDYYERAGKNVNIEANQDKDVSNIIKSKTPTPIPTPTTRTIANDKQPTTTTSMATNSNINDNNETRTSIYFV